MLVNFWCGNLGGGGSIYFEIWEGRAPPPPPGPPALLVPPPMIMLSAGQICCELGTQIHIRCAI